MKKWLIGIIAVLCIALYASVQHSSKVRKDYETAMANVKAYGNKLDSSNRQAVALQLTVSQLEYLKDSVLDELDETRKELKVKDKNLKALQAVQTTFSTRDTVVFRDTLFSEPALALDTIIGDEWYSVNLGFRYPNAISVSPRFVSSKHIVVSTRRETVNPPKKFFLFRWFQKKHDVIRVDVVEQNPHVEEQTSKYVEIIK